MFGIDEVVEKQRCQLVEFCRLFRVQVAAVGCALVTPVDVAMTFNILDETVVHDLALRVYACASVHGLGDFVEQDGVVCAAEHKGVDSRVCFKQFVDVFVYEIVGSRTV